MIGIIPVIKKNQPVLTVSVPPITPSRFESVIAKWAHIAKYGESGSIYFYTKANLLWRIQQLQSSPEVMDRYFGQKKIGYIDAEMSVLEDESDWSEIIADSKNYDVIFILGLDKYLLEKNRQIFTVLEHWQSHNPQISFLYFFQLDFLHPSFASLFSSKSVFLQNTVFEAFHPHRDCLQFIHHMAEVWHMKLTSHQAHTISKVCGNHFWFIKEALRRFRDNPDITIDDIVEHPSMQLKVKHVWNFLLLSEQNVLINIVLTKKNFDEIETHSLKFLEKTDWITHEDQSYKLSIPILELYIKNSVLTFQLEYTDHKILINKVPVDSTFSHFERSVLKLFIKRRNSVVSRDEVAKAIWKEQWQEQYSDWAIDKIISRLRKKLASLGLENSVKTIRNGGFVLNT